MENKKKIVLSILLCLILIILPNLSCRKTSEDKYKNTSVRSMVYDGLKRTYRLHIPSSSNKTKAVPLLFVFHGGEGSGQQMEHLTLGGFNTLSDKEGFMVVYPDGVGKHWNDGRGIKMYRSHKENIDDVGFIDALIEEIAKTFNIDRGRIYATGISNGGFFSQRLACELSEKIAAIAPVAASMTEKISEMSPPERPVSVLIIAGTKDPLVPWEGGEVGIGPLKLGKVLSITETVKKWASYNNCSLSPLVTWLPEKDPKDGTRVRREVYGQGREGSEVILYAIEGGGHTWPGGYQYLPAFIVGKTSGDINANEVIWDFFKKYAID